MTEISEPSGTVRRSHRVSVGRRRAIRRTAAGLCAALGALYLVLFVLVREAEAGLTENTFGAYLLLAVPYLVGAGLLLAVDVRLLWAAGAAAQIVVLALFALFGAGLFGPGEGVFDYAALSDLPVELWAVVISGVEVVVLGLLGYLALTPSHHDAAPRSAASGIGTAVPT
jgi:hypothetical protein